MGKKNFLDYKQANIAGAISHTDHSTQIVSFSGTRAMPVEFMTDKYTANEVLSTVNMR
jgi:hypothetical protein